MKDPLTALKARAAKARATHTYRAEGASLRFTEDLLAAALALGTEALGDALAFGHHAVLHLGTHAVDVVDALEPHVDQFNAQFRRLLGRRREDFLLQAFTALLRLVQIDLANGDALLGQRLDVDVPVG